MPKFSEYENRGLAIEDSPSLLDYQNIGRGNMVVQSKIGRKETEERYQNKYVKPFDTPESAERRAYDDRSIGRNALSILNPIGLGTRIAGNIVEQAGTLGELFDASGDYDNKLMELGRDIKEWADKESGNPFIDILFGKRQFYKKNLYDDFDFSDPNFYLQSVGRDLPSSIGAYALTGLGLGALGRGLTLALARTGSQAMLGQALNLVGTAGTLAYTEGATSAHQVYRDVLDHQLGLGKNFNEAKEIAKEAASSTVKTNTAINTLLNLSGIAAITKPVSKLRDLKKLGLAKEAGEKTPEYLKRMKGKLDNIELPKDKYYGTWKANAVEALQEGAEESVNVFAERMGETEGGLTEDKSIFDTIRNSVFTEEGAVSFVLGAFGGLGQNTFMEKMPTKYYSVDTNGNFIQKKDKDGKPLEGVFEKEWMSVSTRRKNDELRNYVNTVKPIITALEKHQNLVDEIKSVNDDDKMSAEKKKVQLAYLKSRLMELSSHHSVIEGTADYLADAYEELSTVDNTMSLKEGALKAKEQALKQLNEQYSIAEQQQDVNAMEEINKKKADIEKTISQVPDITQAQAYGFSDGKDDNSFKEALLNKANQLRELAKYEREIHDKYRGTKADSLGYTARLIGLKSIETFRKADLNYLENELSKFKLEQSSLFGVDGDTYDFDLTELYVMQSKAEKLKSELDLAEKAAQEVADKYNKLSPAERAELFTKYGVENAEEYSQLLKSRINDLVSDYVETQNAIKGLEDGYVSFLGSKSKKDGSLGEWQQEEFEDVEEGSGENKKIVKVRKVVPNRKKIFKKLQKDIDSFQYNEEYISYLHEQISENKSAYRTVHKLRTKYESLKGRRQYLKKANADLDNELAKLDDIVNDTAYRAEKIKSFRKAAKSIFAAYRDKTSKKKGQAPAKSKVLTPEQEKAREELQQTLRTKATAKKSVNSKVLELNKIFDKIQQDANNLEDIDSGETNTEQAPPFFTFYRSLIDLIEKDTDTKGSFLSIVNYLKNLESFNASVFKSTFDEFKKAYLDAFPENTEQADIPFEVLFEESEISEIISEVVNTQTEEIPVGSDDFSRVFDDVSLNQDEESDEEEEEIDEINVPKNKFTRTLNPTFTMAIKVKDFELDEEGLGVTTSNELNPNLNHLILSNNALKPGTSITLKVLSLEDAGNNLTLKALIEIHKDNPYMAPIGIYYGTQLVAFVHDINYIQDNYSGQTLENERVSIVKLRETVFKNSKEGKSTTAKITKNEDRYLSLNRNVEQLETYTTIPVPFNNTEMVSDKRVKIGVVENNGNVVSTSKEVTGEDGTISNISVLGSLSKNSNNVQEKTGHVVIALPRKTNGTPEQNKGNEYYFRKVGIQKIGKSKAQNIMGLMEYFLQSSFKVSELESKVNKVYTEMYGEDTILNINEKLKRIFSAFVNINKTTLSEEGIPNALSIYLKKKKVENSNEEYYAFTFFTSSENDTAIGYDFTHFNNDSRKEEFEKQLSAMYNKTDLTNIQSSARFKLPIATRTEKGFYKITYDTFNTYEDYVKTFVLTDVLPNKLNTGELVYFDHADIKFSVDEIAEVETEKIIRTRRRRDEAFEESKDDKKEPLLSREIKNLALVNSEIFKQNEEKIKKLQNIKNTLSLSERIFGSSFIEKGKKIAENCKNRQL